MSKVYVMNASDLADFESDCASGDIFAISEFYDRNVAPLLKNQKKNVDNLGDTSGTTESKELG